MPKHEAGSVKLSDITVRSGVLNNYWPISVNRSPTQKQRMVRCQTNERMIERSGGDWYACERFCGMARLDPLRCWYTTDSPARRLSRPFRRVVACEGRERGPLTIDRRFSCVYGILGSCPPLPDEQASPRERK